MPATNAKIWLLCPAALLLALFLCVPAGAAGVAPVQDVAVEVRNHEGGFVGANLIDGDPTTAWVGGGTGVGPGKWIEFTFPGPVRLSALKVANGHQGKGRFKAFRRLVRGVILYPDGVRQKFALKPVPGVQTIPLKSKVAATFKVIITGVAPVAGDKAMGDAKVAVSEMTVLGEPVDPSEAGEALDTAAAPAEKPKPAEMKAASEKKAEPAETGGKAEAGENPAPAAKPESARKPKSAAKPKPAAKAKSAGKPASVPKADKRAARPAQTTAGGATRLRPAVEIPADKPLAMGAISPWLDLELVAGIKRYFSHLTTLSDSYPDVFAADVRERERKAFIALQDKVRRENAFGDHHMAMPELIGLNFDKPVESGQGVSIHVHGPCRYYVGDRGFEFPVDTQITMVRENGAWLIRDVRDR